MGKTLRVLNAVHYYEVGIPITLTQYVTPIAELSILMCLTDITLSPPANSSLA